MAIIEKLGHTKRMQIMRREWINEGKPRNVFQEEKPKRIGSVEAAHLVHEQNSLSPVSTRIQKDPGDPFVVDDSRQYLSPSDPQERTRNLSNDLTAHQESLFLSDDHDSQPSEDDLDVLLAEDLQKEVGAKLVNDKENPQSLPQSILHGEENFDDDLEAMAGMDDMW